MEILVTGGCGFIGSNFIRHVLARYAQDRVVNLDLITYAGNPENLAEVEADFAGRYRLVRGDVCDAAGLLPLVESAEAVVHFAAESHVDRSIEDAADFVRTNAVGSQVVLDCCRRAWGDDPGRRLVHISTDEVYGALSLEDPRRFGEDWPLDPRSPYSASKAAGDLLAQAYAHTYGLAVMVTRCSNNYGPYQFPEKLIPLMILNALEGRELPLYGDGLYVRDWIYVEDNCRATDLVLRRGQPGQVYNVGADNEQANLTLLEMLLELVAQRAGRDLAQLKGLIRHVKDRPGHDRRYAVDAGKIQTELGFATKTPFPQGLARTVEWYLQNPSWCQRVRSGQYRDYYRQMYEGR